MASPPNRFRSVSTQDSRILIPRRQPAQKKQIILRNICTLFNLVNIIFFVAILAVGSVKDTLFMAIVAANTAIGIIQEIRAKRSIDSLSFLTAAKAKVLRRGIVRDSPLTRSFWTIS